ncbi:MAG: hypothetical protein GX825_07390 [Syntrophomonadaceae bacterium]|nr:hypothetical protein [Syntrophomonadaceae bacterium]
MIVNRRYPEKQLYTEMARIIDALRVKGQLSSEEGTCLLDLLDLICAGTSPEFNKTLEEVLEVPGNSDTMEIDEIIKGTLMGTDPKSMDEVAQVVGIITDLHKERNRILRLNDESGG